MTNNVRWVLTEDVYNYQAFSSLMIQKQSSSVPFHHSCIVLKVRNLAQQWPRFYSKENWQSTNFPQKHGHFSSNPILLAHLMSCESHVWLNGMPAISPRRLHQFNLLIYPPMKIEYGILMNCVLLLRMLIFVSYVAGLLIFHRNRNRKGSRSRKQSCLKSFKLENSCFQAFWLI